MRYPVGLGLLVLIATSYGATAQAIGPAVACTKMKDAAGCACAAATGGTVSATSWARGADRYAFESCLAARGSAPVSTRPATIPGRL